MARFQCLLCDMPFNKPANHFCARECRPGAGQHVDFCRRCKTECLNSFEPQVTPAETNEPEDGMVPSPESRRTNGEHGISS
jgi:hypothetical protein